MAERKKKTTAKKTAQPSKKNEKAESKDFANQQWSVLLFALAALILLLALVQGSAGWYAVHRAIKGVFGLTLLAIPPMLAYFAIMLDKNEEPQKIARRAGVCVAAVIFFSGFIEIMFGGGRLQEETLPSALKLLYEDGVAWSGGGALSAVLAMPFMSVLGDIGSKIMICLFLFVSLMLLTKKSLVEVLKFLAAPFLNLWKLLRDDYAHGSEEKVFVREPDTSELLPEEEPEALPLPEAEEEPIPIENIGMEAPKPRPRTVERSPEEQKLLDALDIPVSDEWPVATQNEAESGTEQDAALDDLIRQATEKPKKKTKEEQRQEAVTEIAEEVAKQAVAEQSSKYRMPPTGFLQESQSFAKDPSVVKELREKADALKEVLQSFNVSVRITNIARGPAVTRYEVQPGAGVKVSKITGLSDNIALTLAAQGVRIEAPIPGKAAIGIEVPNSRKDTVALREILESKAFVESKSKLTFAVGKDIAGNIIIGDIAKMPHMIIAGSTGSGKSVCTNSIIMSILYHAHPSEVKLILIDPKIVEFRVYDGIPHLLIPVVTDPKKAAGALNWAVQEMLKRYNIFAETGVRDLADYNRLCGERDDLEPMPQIVIAIDELADLMMASSKDVEDAICRLAQMARAAGMHLIIATQRPTTDIITGLIKANIPSRVALSVMSQIDSRTILDMGGAEKLLGNGDMLYLPNGQPKPVRIQGCFVSTQEIERTVSFIKMQSESEYDESIMKAVDQIVASGEEAPASDEEPHGDGDSDLIEKAIEVVVYAGQASTSNLQRRLKLGYARAARIMDELEEMGIIGPYEGAKPRRVLLTKMQYEERKLRKMNDNG